MLYKRKIRLMTKLAIYDKKYGSIDKKNSDFFKWDYIYFRNFGIRIGVLFGCLILSALYVFKRIVVDQIDITSIDIKADATKIGVFVVAVLGVYTIIGARIAKKEYEESKERLAAYFSMLDKLDRFDERQRLRAAEQNQKIERESFERFDYTEDPRPSKKVNKTAQNMNIVDSNKKTRQENKERLNDLKMQVDERRRQRNKAQGERLDNGQPSFENTFVKRQYLTNLKGEAGFGTDDRHENPNNSRI